MALGNQNKRILYLVSLFPCWSETFIVREIHALRGMGADVSIFSLKHPSETMVQDDAAKLNDLVVYPPGLIESIVNVLAALLRKPITNIGFLFLLAFRLFKQPEAFIKSLIVWFRTLATIPLIKKLNPEIIHAHWATYPSTGAMLLSKNLGVPFGFTSHAHDIFLENQLLEEKFDSCGYSVTISNFNIEYLSNLIKKSAVPVMKDKINIVHCGIMVDEFVFDRREKLKSKILSVGRLIDMKGFEELLVACSILRDKGVNFECEIIGDGPNKNALLGLIKDKELSEHVKMLGVQPQNVIKKKLLEATMFVLGSKVDANGDRDGIPVALMEAMAVGTPVVSTDVSGIPELINDRKNGIMVSAGNAEALASGMIALLNDVALQESCAIAARSTIETDFNAPVEAAKLYSIMESSQNEQSKN